MVDSASNARRLAALRYRDFRLVWIGELISTTGTQMQLFAINWHIVQLLRNQSLTFILLGHTTVVQGESLAALGLGTVGLARVIPIVIFALLGGMIADARDRRMVLIWGRFLACVLAAVLAWMTLAGTVTVLAIYALTAATSGVGAFANPARQAMIPSLVPQQHLTNAVSLNTLMFQITSIAGPGLFALFISFADIGIIYALNAVSFFAAIYALWMMEYRGTIAVNSAIGWKPLVEGLRFTYRSRIIWGTMLLDFFATFFSSAQTMLPLVVSDVLRLDARWYGILGTAQPLGAVIAGSAVALRRDIKRQGVVLLVSIGIYGLATAVFGLSTSFGLSYIMYALTGAGDTVSTVIRGTLRQVLTPDYLRGRMTSVNMIFFMGGPQLGELEAGLVASLLGVPFSIFSGGVATVLLTCWIAWKNPNLRNYVSQLTAG
jgi:MFS family permease